MPLTRTVMDTDVVILTRSQAAKAIRESAENILREIGPKFRLDERDRPGKKWLTNREAQEYLGLSKATLARYRASGKLPFSRVGSSVYYRLSDVEALLESGMQRNGAD